MIPARRSSQQSVIESPLACVANRQNGRCHMEKSEKERRGEEGGRGRRKGREGESGESTDGSDIAKWCAGLKHPCGAENVELNLDFIRTQ